MVIGADIAAMRRMAAETGMDERFRQHVLTHDRHSVNDLTFFLAWDFDDEKLIIAPYLVIPHNTLAIMEGFVPSRKSKGEAVVREIRYQWEPKEINQYGWEQINTGIGENRQ